MTTLIRGGIVVPVRPAGRVIRDGAVAFDDSGRITGVGPNRQFNPADYTQVIDARNNIVMPGMINAHSHCLSNLAKGWFEKFPLEIWRQYVKGCWRHITEEDIYLATMASGIEMVRNGCTAALEHFDSIHPSEHRGAGQVIQAWLDLGFRGVLAPMLIDKPYEETVPLDAGSASEAGRAEIARISRHESRATLDDVEQLLKKQMRRSSRITFFLGPGAPQRCTEGLLRDATALARQLDVGLHMHVLETRSQRFFTLKTFGKTAVQHLYDIGFLCDRLSMAHCVWIADQDIPLIRERGASVVHNPHSNLKLGSGIAPVIKLLRGGVNVAVATDGAASNDALNMFESMRLGALLHCVTDDDFERWVSAQEALEMTTINAARACRLESVCGSLEPGKRADIVLLKRRHHNFMPTNDVVHQLVYCENGSAVDTVIIDGHTVLRNGSFVGIGEQEIFGRIDAAAERLAPQFTREHANVRGLESSLRAMYFQVVRNQVGR